MIRTILSLFVLACVAAVVTGCHAQGSVGTNGASQMSIAK